MAVNWAGLWRIAQAAFGIADASRQLFGVPQAPPVDHDDAALTRAASGGVLGHLEARLTGVVVSALKEAFDRDAARLDLERAALEDQRRRAEEALRLELVRQAGERAVARHRFIGGFAVAIWIVSVIFLMRFAGGLAGGGRIVLALGWLSLLGATAASFAAHTQATRWIAAAQVTRSAPDSLPEGGPSAAGPWLALAGLALVGVSLLIAI
jgi:hypothetical protein